MKRFIRLLALLLAFLFLFSACGAPSDEVVDTSGSDTKAPEGSEEDTGDQKELEIYIEREDKEVKNILMIGNSFCFYYVEELCGIAKADGYELNVANLYKSGAPLSVHYNSFMNDTKDATLYLTNSQKRREWGPHTFKEALDFANERLGGDWDVISLQGNSYYAWLGDLEQHTSNSLTYAEKLYDYIRETHPDATLYWHQMWAYEVGYNQGENKQVKTVEHRTSMYEIRKAASYTIAEKTGVRIMPTGDAWEIARKNALIGTTLCQRKSVKNGEGDYYHDGDIGGGQYLNACVWYEVLMGESCVGNTWRPTYDLSEEKIAILQAAAHDAVAAVYGPGYAK